MKKILYLTSILIFLFVGCTTTKIEKDSTPSSEQGINKLNLELEEAVKNYALYDELVSRGFDIHSLDYITNPYQIIYAIKPYIYNADGTCIDNHLRLTNTSFNFSRMTEVDFGKCPEADTKEKLLEKGYIENQTMFPYPLCGKNMYVIGERKIVPFSYVEGYEQTFIKSNETKEVAFAAYKRDEYTYIKIQSFNILTDELPRIMSTLKNKKMVIVDLTTCHGGEGWTAFSFAEVLKNLKSLEKIYVLTTTNTLSAGELFSETLKNSEKVKLVGTNTGGCMSTIHYDKDFIKVLDSNTYILLSSKAAESSVEESVGIFPDFWAINFSAMLKTVHLDSGINCEEIQSVIKTQKGLYLYTAF